MKKLIAEMTVKEVVHEFEHNMEDFYGGTFAYMSALCGLAFYGKLLNYVRGGNVKSDVARKTGNDLAWLIEADGPYFASYVRGNKFPEALSSEESLAFLNRNLVIVDEIEELMENLVYLTPMFSASLSCDLAVIRRAFRSAEQMIKHNLNYLIKKQVKKGLLEEDSALYNQYFQIKE